MKVYDFDKTIYPVDSTAAFYLWTLGHCPRALLSLGRTAAAFLLMGLHLLPKTRCKEMFYSFLRRVPPEAEGRFWAEKMDKICPWYLAQRQPEDVVISASPEFLLRPAAEKLGFSLIATRIRRSDGKTEGLNCHGEEKVRRFRELYPESVVEEFYSDSLSDGPMARLAERAYLVRGDKRLPWPEKDGLRRVKRSAGRR